MHQEQLESHKRTCEQKHEKERRIFEEEKRRRMQDISSAIEKLNIASADKEKLKDEVDSLNREQRVLQGKIDQTDRALEAERAKKRAAEREMNEINL